MKSVRFSRKYLSIPYVLFLICFVVLPIFIIIYYACTDAEGQFSLSNLVIFFQSKAKIVDLIRSFLLAGVNTALCLLIAYPLALILSNKKYNKSYIVVTFMSILELAKEEDITLTQESNFDKIFIELKVK